MVLLENEELKEIEGYPNYLISSYGRVWSKKSQIWLKQSWRGDKSINSMYLCVSLSNHGQVKSYAVHRLVALAFIPNPNNYNQVNHKDEDKSNNKKENLEWCNNQYNMTYGTRIQKAIATKKANGNIKAVWQCDKQTHKRIKKFDSQKEAALALGIDNRGYTKIGEVCRGNRPSAFGYYWEFD